MVQVLLEYGVDVNAQNSYCDTPLEFASYGSGEQSRVARLLIEQGADPNVRCWEGFTPLNRALERRRIEIAHVLIERGASVQVKDDNGRTPLDIASEEQREEILNLLLEHGAR